MDVAAVPHYLEKHLRDLEDGVNISPGHRFGLFFPVWEKDSWRLNEKTKTNALSQVLSTNAPQISLLEAIVARQQHLATSNHPTHFSVAAKATAPFISGIGYEHPLENGFSFLSPYGLPYLPGSSVKGVVRRAAEQLATGWADENQLWEFIYIWILFGFDASSGYLSEPSRRDSDDFVLSERRQLHHSFLHYAEAKLYDPAALMYFLGSVLSGEDLVHYLKDPAVFLKDLANSKSGSLNEKTALCERIHYQGALRFWDVFPRPPRNSIPHGLFKMDILTPHYGTYYQQSDPPADCGQPLPNVFLTVAPGCDFIFHVDCKLSNVPEPLRSRCHDLLSQAFSHAFEWLGFGAKTSVGYGQMEHYEPYRVQKGMKPSAPPESQVPHRQDTVEPAVEVEVWDGATLIWTIQNKRLTVTHQVEKRDAKPRTAFWIDPDRSKIPEAMHKRLFKDRRAVRAKVTVSVRGNLFEIVSIEDN